MYWYFRLGAAGQGFVQEPCMIVSSTVCTQCNYFNVFCSVLHPSELQWCAQHNLNNITNQMYMHSMFKQAVNWLLCFTVVSKKTFILLLPLSKQQNKNESAELTHIHTYRNREGDGPAALWYFINCHSRSQLAFSPDSPLSTPLPVVSLPLLPLSVTH